MQEVANGIKSFQSFVGLKVSGELNEDTRRTMASPRCGVSDVASGREKNPFKMKVSHRNKRYAILYHLANGKTTRYKWSKPIVTWNIITYYKGLTKAHQEAQFAKAFNVWEYSSQLKFVRSNSRTPDIRISFESGEFTNQAVSTSTRCQVLY